MQVGNWLFHCSIRAKESGDAERIRVSSSFSDSRDRHLDASPSLKEDE